MDLERYIEAFEANDIEAAILRTLNADDLRELGVASLGHRKKLLDAIAGLGPVRPRLTMQVVGGTATAREAERRQLTVLFCDLVGSTELAARLDPEDMGQVIGAYQEACVAVVKRWDGHVAKFLGDGVLAYFGWPQAHEDDAERAVRSGLKLVESVGGLVTPGGQKLAARVGIATGLVMVGELAGEGIAQEAAVVGETPNLAARLQALAEPGALVIAASTRRLLGGLFALTDLGPFRLKGFAEPLAAFQVEGEGRAEGRFEALHGGRLTPLVGRDHELAMLMERWTRAKEGEGQVVLISGEPGIGKSRLLRALRQEVSAEPHTALSHFCSPHHTNSALHPVIMQLERAAGFASDDDPEAKLAKLATLLGGATEQVDEVVPLVAALLGLPASDRYPSLNLSLQRQKQRTLEVLIEQLAGLARRRPVLEVYEDVHWIDPSTLELLDLLVERVRPLPVLVVLTYRPEFSPPWTGRAHVTSLTLNRLGRRQAAGIVQRITGGKALPAEMLDQVVARTDGVPLFVEELTKAVLESGLLTDAGDRYQLAGPLAAMAIPATLHDSLMARLDRLAPVKEVAQMAAAIGREFPHDLLAAVSPLPGAELNAAIDKLVSSELIFRRGTPPHASYSFKHALVQEAAYQSLLKSRRQHLHARIADVLEERFAKIADAAPEVLAHHRTEAGTVVRAIPHWLRSGQIAARRPAYPEALAHLSRALELLEQVEDKGQRDRLEVPLQMAVAMAVQAGRGPIDEVATRYARARDLSAAVGDRRQLYAATWGLWFFQEVRMNFEEARRLGDELLMLAEEQADAALLLQAHHAAWTTAVYRGEPRRAYDHAEQGRALYREDRDHALTAAYGGHDAGACCRYTAGHASWLLGYPDQALERAEDAVALARRLGHPVSLCIAELILTVICQCRGEVERVGELAGGLVASATRQGLVWYAATAAVLQGWALAAHGDMTAGSEKMGVGLDQLRASGAGLRRSYLLWLLAEASIRAGAIERGASALSDALQFIGERGERWWEAELCRLEGAVRQRQDGAAEKEVEHCFRRALDIAGQQEAKSLELRAATSLARLWAEQGKRKNARNLLAPIYGWFTEGFETADLKDAKRLIDSLA